MKTIPRTKRIMDKVQKFLCNFVAQITESPKVHINEIGSWFQKQAEKEGFSFKSPSKFNLVLQTIQNNQPNVWKLILHLYCYYDERYSLTPAAKMLLLVICAQVETENKTCTE
eukprot:TRINITY_DN3987_c0_g2_i1.p1 TRINITY_DN3987_c0_g2~~TRINITY_DN3987_c0_g2_i1.p1  ORF type:complete len:113 (+),score=10.31 TRINITY_DN3987_c0_g2_i1:976-1314(+)